MNLTAGQLLAAMPKAAKAKREAALPHLNAAMAEFGIDTPKRQAAFLAQIAHETGELSWLREIWGPTPQQRKYEPPGPLAKQLGNTKKGDGQRYRGRGALQLTGRDNYRRFGHLLGVNLEESPDQAAEFGLAFRIAGLFWQERGLNELADRDAFEAVTKKINGGLNGLASREAYWHRAKGALLA